MSADTLTRTTLQVVGLTKAFDANLALAGVDVDFAAGEVHALMGENGSGKSTLIKVLAGFHTADAGQTLVDAKPFSPTHAGESRAAGLRFVHQELALVESMSSAENLALYRGYTTRGGFIRWGEDRRLAREAVARLGYHFDVTVPVGDLSAAERTVVAIARALDDDGCRFLVLDEPTASLSGPEAARLFELLENVRADGVGVILVSHHIDEVMGISDRVTVLRDGQLVGTHATADLSKDRLVELMTGHTVAEVGTGKDAIDAGEPLFRATGLSARDLEPFDLAVAPGEIVGIAGLTGSGRDTLASFLSGRTTPDAGTLRIGDAELKRPRPERLTALGLRYVSGDRARDGLFPGSTVRENVIIGELASLTTRLGLSRRLIDAEVSDVVERFDVRPRRTDVDITALSGGNAQKVILARALRATPRVLVLDDPTRGVDISAKEELHRIVEAAAASGAAVIICSSDSAELVRLAHRVLVLKHGRVAHQVTGAEIDADALTRLAL